ncbi:uncharacterized protein Dana_GF26350, isoform A [Drosophila ananassae]|uniref:Uncharacterized protein, isoform A n=1 Tax=Drosophila ananassae TaxID=7217 RepID=A0A0P8XHD1_DROAN|nr:uncharacterized protein Dana_GF26350, isoform A [Drosophila ananassae]
MSESSTEDYSPNDGDSNGSEGSSVAAPANNDADDAMILDFINQHANYIDVSSASANLDNQPEEDFNLDLNFDWTTMVNNDMCQPLIDLSEDAAEGAEGPSSSGRRPIGKNISNQMPESDVETESDTDSEGNVSNDGASDDDSSSDSPNGDNDEADLTGRDSKDLEDSNDMPSTSTGGSSSSTSPTTSSDAVDGMKDSTPEAEDASENLSDSGVQDRPAGGKPSFGSYPRNYPAAGKPSLSCKPPRTPRGGKGSGKVIQSGGKLSRPMAANQLNRAMPVAQKPLHPYMPPSRGKQINNYAYTQQRGKQIHNMMPPGGKLSRGKQISNAPPPRRPPSGKKISMTAKSKHIRNIERLICSAFDGRKYRTLRDIRARTNLSKDCIRRVLRKIAKIKRTKWRISVFYLEAYHTEVYGVPHTKKYKPLALNRLYRQVISCFDGRKFLRMEDMVEKTGLPESQVRSALKMIGRKRSTKWRLLDYQKPEVHIHRGHRRINRGDSSDDY